MSSYNIQICDDSGKTVASMTTDSYLLVYTGKGQGDEEVKFKATGNMNPKTIGSMIGPSIIKGIVNKFA